MARITPCIKDGLLRFLRRAFHARLRLRAKRGGNIEAYGVRHVHGRPLWSPMHLLLPKTRPAIHRLTCIRPDLSRPVNSLMLNRHRIPLLFSDPITHPRISALHHPHTSGTHPRSRSRQVGRLRRAGRPQRRRARRFVRGLSSVHRSESQCIVCYR